LPGRTGASGASTFQRSIKKSSPRTRTRRRVEVHAGRTPEDPGARGASSYLRPSRAVCLRSVARRSGVAPPARSRRRTKRSRCIRPIHPLDLSAASGAALLHPNVSTSSFTLSPMSCILWIGWDGLGTGFD
jgi:hypothetical protein